MTKRTTVLLSRVQHFLRRELPTRLKEDLESFRYVREADVQCATYMYLRGLLDGDPNWHVLAELHSPQTGKYIDLMILQKSIPRIAIEIKWGRKNMGKKDRESLSKSLRDLGVNKAYWLSVSVLGEPPPPLEKEPHERHKLHQVVVRAKLDDAALAKWKEVRLHLRRKPKVGRGKGMVKPSENEA